MCGVECACCDPCCMWPDGFCLGAWYICIYERIVLNYKARLIKYNIILAMWFAAIDILILSIYKGCK